MSRVRTIRNAAIRGIKPFYVKVNDPERFLRKARTIATTSDEPVEEQEAVVETEATPKKVKQPKEGMSALDAAHKVLVEISTPLNAKQITELVIERGYCPNLKGATPHATISSAIQRAIAKGNESRFYKAGKGLFGAVENKSE